MVVHSFFLRYSPARAGSSSSSSPLVILALSASRLASLSRCAFVVGTGMSGAGTLGAGLAAFRFGEVAGFLNDLGSENDGAEARVVAFFIPVDVKVDVNMLLRSSACFRMLSEDILNSSTSFLLSFAFLCATSSCDCLAFSIVARVVRDCSKDLRIWVNVSDSPAGAPVYEAVTVEADEAAEVLPLAKPPPEAFFLSSICSFLRRSFCNRSDSEAKAGGGLVSFKGSFRSLLSQSHLCFNLGNAPLKVNLFLHIHGGSGRGLIHWRRGGHWNGGWVCVLIVRGGVDIKVMPVGLV